MKLTIRTLLLFSFIFAFKARAYFTTAESGDIPDRDNIRLGVLPQIRLSDGTGMNFAGFFDKALNESSSVRGLAGGGNTNFFAGLSYKWIPIPDYENQPAVGAKIEALYAKLDDDNATALRLHPLVSKKMETDWGLLIPYGSLPLSLINSKSSSDMALQLVGGSEYYHPDLKQWGFGAEIGFSLSKSFNYIAGFATFTFDERQGLRGKK